MEALEWLAHPYLYPQLTHGRQCGARASDWHTGRPKSASGHVCDLEQERESIPLKPVRARIVNWHEDMGVKRAMSTGQISQMCVNVQGKGSGEG